MENPIELVARRERRHFINDVFSRKVHRASCGMEIVVKNIEYLSGV
ncbi:MAG: hypothetical protein IMW89_03525 [Ktedonobacteraceae bacterium]|nr:hypothetical protein [Ktedonobacteraceae bacterium]